MVYQLYYLLSTTESEFDEGDDDEEDESEDEEDVFAEADVENASMSPSSLRRNSSIERNHNQRSTGAIPATRKPDDLREQYESIFLEYVQEDKVRSQ